jgi:16S rRNA G1207 methylase RsmC
MYYAANKGETTKMVDAYDSNGDYWIAKVGAGYGWFRENFRKASEKAMEGDTIVIMMGVNDCLNHSAHELYEEFINGKKTSLEKRGVRLVFCYVNPISKSTKYSTKNEDVEFFNEAIKDKIPGVDYIDTYSMIAGNVDYAGDGLHYDRGTSKRLYNIIQEVV